MFWPFKRRPPIASGGMVGNPVAVDPIAPPHLHHAVARIETIRGYIAERSEPGAKPPPEGRLDELAAEVRRLKGVLAAAGIKAE